MAINYGLFFTKGSTVIRLPVNPEELPEAQENANSEYNVLGLGPIMVPRIPKLKTVRISSLLPGRPVGGWVLTKGGFEPPSFISTFSAQRCGTRSRFCTRRCATMRMARLT